MRGGLSADGVEVKVEGGACQRPLPALTVHAALTAAASAALATTAGTRP